MPIDWMWPLRRRLIRSSRSAA